MRTVSSVLFGLGIAVAAATGAHAQTASELLDQGIAAYEEFDFPAAACSMIPAAPLASNQA